MAVLNTSQRDEIFAAYSTLLSQDRSALSSQISQAELRASVDQLDAAFDAVTDFIDDLSAGDVKTNITLPQIRELAKLVILKRLEVL